MKTTLSFSSSLSYALSLFLSASLIGGPSLSFAASEVVKSTTNTPRGKLAATEDVPTPEEISMGAVKSPYKACAGVVTVERSPRPTGSTKAGRTPAQIEWDKKDAFWKNYPAQGCDSTKVNCTRKVQFIPDTHFYKSFDGRAPRTEFTSNESASDFLKRVAATSAAKAQTRIDDMKKEKACLEAGTGDCMKTYLARIEVLKTKAAEFRLQVARYNEISDSFLSKSGTMPKNSGILVVKDFEQAKESMVVPKDMPELSTKERAGLMKEMDTFLDRAFSENVAEIEKGIKERKFATKGEEDRYRSVVLASGRDTRWIKPQMDAQREKALAGYLKLLADYPELGYMNEADLNAKNMPSKITGMIKEAEESLASMKDGAKASVSEPGGVHKKLLAFAAHTQTIEEMLAKEGDGHSCAAANATLNELATVRTKEGLVVGGISVAAMAVTGVVGSRVVGAAAAAGLITETGVAVGGHIVGGLAFLSGAVPGIQETVHSINEIDDQARDARVGIVKPEDAQKALDGKAATQIMGLLNFQGSGHLIAAGAGVASGAFSKYLVARSIKNAVAKGGGGAAGKTADSIVADVAKASAGDATAAKSVASVTSAAEKDLFKGAKPSDADRKALDAVVSKGLAGTAEAPDQAVVQAYVDNLAGMQGPNKAGYAKRVEDVASGVKPNVGDAARQRAVGKAVVEVGEGDVKTELQILNDPAWDAAAIDGRTAIKEELKNTKGTMKERFIAAWKKLWKKTGQPAEKDEVIAQRGVCGGFFPAAGVAGPYDGNPFGETPPKFMACAAPADTTSL